MVERVAALADVHGNAPALEAVLEEVDRAGVDVVVFCGDLVWGPFPRETLALARALGERARYVRGNADRAIAEDARDRAVWLRDELGADGCAFVAAFEPTVALEVQELGRVVFSHGSPRSDEECVTMRTPTERVREFLDGIDANAVVTAHTHVRYDRIVDGVRLLNAGSVGLPYGEEPGAYWALLGPDIDFRRTAYDVDATMARIRGTDDPGREATLELMLAPPGKDEVIADAEERVFAG
jgi:putative phosphoesterase